MTDYVILFPADDETAWAAATPDARQATYDTDAEFARLLKEAGGRITGGAALQPSSATLTLARGEGADPIVTDGPFAETVEQLSGFYLVTCDDADALLRAARVLVSAHPVVEIRPVDES